MPKALYVMMTLLCVMLLSLFCCSQTIERPKLYKITDNYTKTTADGKDILVTNYTYKGKPVTTWEKYFRDRDSQIKELRTIKDKGWSCSDEDRIIDKKGYVSGNKYLCKTKVSGKKIFILGYSYYDSLNKVIYIIASSPLVIDEFAEGICPIALQLYNDDKGCPALP